MTWKVHGQPGGRPRAGLTRPRKVRASQDTVVGNAHRPQGQGKCNRKQTAVGATPTPVFELGHRLLRWAALKVRVKRCGPIRP